MDGIKSNGIILLIEIRPIHIRRRNCKVIGTAEIAARCSTFNTSMRWMERVKEQDFARVGCLIGSYHFKWQRGLNTFCYNKFSSGWNERVFNMIGEYSLIGFDIYVIANYSDNRTRLECIVGICVI